MREKYPQQINAATACVVQSEWIFLQLITKDMGQAFVGLEKNSSSFLWKNKKPFSNFRSSKYISGTEIRSETTESRDISKGEIHQFAKCEMQDDYCSHK